MIYFTESSVENGKFVYCRNVKGLVNYMGLPNYDPSDWRFFVDSSKRCMKCVLLHNGNEYAQCP